MAAAFVSPIGESVKDPSESFIGSVFSCGTEYWQDLEGCGHGVFEYYENGLRKRTIEVTHKDGLGFYLAYVDRVPDGHKHFVAINLPVASRNAVEFQYCGEPFFIPVALLIPKETAMAAVKQFCQFGSQPDQIHWAPLTELAWDSTSGAWKVPQELE